MKKNLIIIIALGFIGALFGICISENKESLANEAKETLKYAKKEGEYCPCSRITSKTSLDVDKYLRTGQKEYLSSPIYYACDTFSIIVYNKNLNMYTGCLPAESKTAKKYRRVPEYDWTDM